MAKMNRESFGDNFGDIQRNLNKEIGSFARDVMGLNEKFKETQEEVFQLKKELTVVHDSLQCLRREILTEKKETSGMNREIFEDLNSGTWFEKLEKNYIKIVPLHSTILNAVNLNDGECVYIAGFVEVTSLIKGNISK